MNKNMENRFVWLGGKIVNVNDASINVLSPTAQFGLNVFEGIRCYWNAERKKLFAFRLDDHHKRLQRSIKLLQLDSPYSQSELERAFLEVIWANNYKEDIAVRQTVFVDGFGSWGSEGPVNMFISPIPKAKSSIEYNKKSLKCCVSSWRRISDSVLSPRIKCGANYINSRMAQREALKNGYDTTIFLNDAGKVAEGPGSCLFLVKDGVLVTPLLTDSVLESITRDSIIRIAKDMGIETVERSVDRTELYTAEEVFLCGSAMEITPVHSVDRYEIVGETMGEITSRIHKKYLDIVIGNDEKYSNWLTIVGY